MYFIRQFLFFFCPDTLCRLASYPEIGNSNLKYTMWTINEQWLALNLLVRYEVSIVLLLTSSCEALSGYVKFFLSGSQIPLADGRAEGEMTHQSWLNICNLNPIDQLAWRFSFNKYDPSFQQVIPDVVLIMS